MILPLSLCLVWLIVANVIGLFPSRDYHWRAAYALIAIGVPLLGWVTYEGGPVVGLLVLAAGLVFIYTGQADQRASELAEVDAALLTDDLPPSATGLLVEFRDESPEQSEASQAAADALLRGLTLLEPTTFTRERGDDRTRDGGAAP